MKLEQREANRECWGARVEGWRASGEKLSTWAREQNISRDALEYWKRQFSITEILPTPASRSLTLIPLQTAVPAVCAAPIEIAIDRQSGLHIRLPVDFSPASLARLLGVLEARC